MCRSGHHHHLRGFDQEECVFHPWGAVEAEVEEVEEVVEEAVVVAEVVVEEVVVAEAVVCLGLLARARRRFDNLPR